MECPAGKMRKLGWTAVASLWCLSHHTTMLGGGRRRVQGVEKRHAPRDGCVRKDMLAKTNSYTSMRARKTHTLDAYRCTLCVSYVCVRARTLT